MFVEARSRSAYSNENSHWIETHASTALAFTHFAQRVGDKI
jgi:hypothetical protein